MNGFLVDTKVYFDFGLDQKETDLDMSVSIYLEKRESVENVPVDSNDIEVVVKIKVKINIV